MRRFKAIGQTAAVVDNASIGTIFAASLRKSEEEFVVECFFSWFNRQHRDYNFLFRRSELKTRLTDDTANRVVLRRVTLARIVRLVLRGARGHTRSLILCLVRPFEYDETTESTPRLTTEPAH
jgi:hypothetical protein